MKYNVKQKAALVETFIKTFHEGPQKLLSMVDAKFFKIDEKENDDKELKEIFIEAAYKLFQGETTVDRITILELKKEFENNEKLLKIQNECNIKLKYLEEYQSQRLENHFLELLTDVDTEKQKLKNFILRRFINDDNGKNLNIEEKKKCFDCTLKVIKGEKKSTLIEEQDINDIIKIFNSSNALIDLQKTLEIDLPGYSNEDSSQDS